jgi:hypothetical protein
VKSARYRKMKVACFLSYVENRLNTNISIMFYTYKYIENMPPKVGLLQETKEEEKKKERQ